ncbi:restriction endonuclease [Actinacidiphila glaucinigra]|uniref:nSTAND3 domain-containing NTPase n=1 Tax=Actinacidiphila glaucinigra TaxID=235986 RepID=UPI003D8D6A0B
MSRNYADLSPHDFEILIRDLLQAEFGVRMETFPQGRDGGVDIRLHHNGVESIVIQCKHSPGRTFAQIKSQLESEAKKIGSRFTARYMLATSASLTRANKSEIAAMFSGVRLREGDILGVGDIDNLLRRHPSVETRNFKLWITSSAVLERLLNSELYQRSAGLVERIAKRRKMFVHSEAFPRALEKLNDHHVCIISGEPGIGKTTLAETLLVKLMSDGWAVSVASEDIAEVERAWNPQERQVFLYDDFLGQNSLLNKNEDGRLAQVVERIREAENKLLIMTTREYILQQAELAYERLQRVHEMESGKILLDLAHYTREQRAHIFYNHIHFSGLDKGAHQSILREKRYRNIVSHSNFNPRIIELVTSNFANSGVEAESFYEYAIGALNNPSDLWEKIFQSQLTAIERHVLIVLATVREAIELGDLLRALTAYEDSLQTSRTDRRELNLALKKLQGTFIHINSGMRLDDPANGVHPENYSTMVELANPSFIDYVSTYLASHPEEVSQVARGCAFFEQVETLVYWDLGTAIERMPYAITRDTFLDALSFSNRGPRLASGQQHLLMQAMGHLIGTPSCYWETGGRKPVVTRGRHVFMLLLDLKYQRTLLSRETLHLMIGGVRERISSRSDIVSELPLMRYLAKYSTVAEAMAEIRDMAASKLMESLEGPESYQVALSVFMEIDVASSRRSEVMEAELRRGFREFAYAWDQGESARVNDILECQKSLESLRAAVEDFGLDTTNGTRALSEKLVLLQDELDAEYGFDGDEEEDVDEEGIETRRNAADAGSRKARRSPKADPVDDLFDSLS